MCECTPKCRAIKLLVLGLVLVLIRYYKSDWDIWTVIGALLIIKAVLMFIMPICPCNKSNKAQVKKRKLFFIFQ